MCRRSIFLILVIISSLTAVQAAPLDQSSETMLVQMERKYFSKTFDRDPLEVRVARIERLVFGGTKDGDAAGRIGYLANATNSFTVPEPGARATAPAPRNIAPPAAQSAAPATTTNNAYALKPDDVGQDDHDEPPGSGDQYPRITKLEKAILGQSYLGEKLKLRLARLEQKAFGHTSPSADLSDRTDALQQFAAEKLHMAQRDPEDSDQVVGGSGGSVGESDIGEAPKSDYPHVTALEKTILGETYGGQPLTDRLARLETKAFGHASASTDMAQRTDALESYAEKVLHKRPGGGEDGDHSSAHQDSSTAKSLLTTVGHSLMNMLGGGGSVGSGGPMLGGGPMIGSPMGMFGMGGPIGYRPMPYGGRNPADVEPPRENREGAKADLDPMITQKSPPPSSASMQTKVSWCEMQVFGQTFPKLHLTERLAKLNHEINFAPGEPDVKLMDDVPKLVSAVQAQKMSSAKQPVTR